MPIVKSLKSLGVALLGSFDGLGFVKVIRLPLPCLSFLWSWVGQVAFSGRTP